MAIAPKSEPAIDSIDVFGSPSLCEPIHERIAAPPFFRGGIATRATGQMPLLA
ncbi:hypothetical protein [Paraburkholderia phytofirmans]|uniref:hypothetical protein n=1 Tax=Paraburkholderia phytofirmans TaxID=261302 RepID=UPI0038BCE966